MEKKKKNPQYPEYYLTFVQKYSNTFCRQEVYTAKCETGNTNFLIYVYLFFLFFFFFKVWIICVIKN